MTQRQKSFTKQLIVAFSAIYMCFSFIELTPNFWDWTYGTRVFLVIVLLFGLFIVSIINID